MTLDPRFTVDANVLVYAVDGRTAKRPAAVQIIREAATGGGVLTIQALGEFYNACARKGIVSRGEAAAQVRRWLIAFPPPLAHVAGCLPVALDASEAGRFAFWDAMLLATAAIAGCTAVISEDMADGATLGTIRVVRAFDGVSVSAPALALLEGRPLLDTPPPTP